MQQKQVILIIVALIALYFINDRLVSEGFYGYQRAEGYPSNPSIRSPHASYGYAADGPSLILFKSDDCQYCNALKPEWNRVVKNFRGKRTLNIREFDNKRNADVIKTQGITLFPTIRFYPKGIVAGQYIEYTGERTYEGLLAFINKNGTY